MGTCVSSQYDDEKKRSQSIDKWLDESNKKLKKECKILLLGSGESGKSTVVKQMRIIHKNGYPPEELATWRGTVYRNLLDSARVLIMGMPKLGLEFKYPENEEKAEIILQFNPLPELTADMMQDVLKAIDSIWQDPSARECLERRNSEFYISDSAPYFFDEIQRIMDPNYLPSEQDVLRARAKSTGISETRFNAGDLRIHMFDVGGQRSERKKWIHCFENVTSIIFCVALSEYDQVLLEDTDQNRMIESLILFESVTNSRWFIRTSIILFLNKVDLFRVKILKVPLENYFPDYGGGPNVNKAAKYILWRFMQMNRAGLNVYPHMTNATDTSNIRLVFAAVRETVLQNALKDSGIL